MRQSSTLPHRFFYCFIIWYVQNIFINDLFDLNHTIAKPLLEKFDYGWQAVAGLKTLISELIKGLDRDEYEEIREGVWAHKSAKVDPSAKIIAPCIIGADSEVRHCAFIRGSALIGKNCVVGNSCEIKNSLLFDGAQVPHFNYVGDSILGYSSHLGAGVILSNLRCDKTKIIVKGEKTYPTGLKKFGALVGDCAEIGCNCVINPGSVIGKKVTIYPLTSVKGVVLKEEKNG